MKAILCFGDSILFGRGVSPCRSCATILKEDFESQNQFNCTYVLGVPGHTSEDLLFRFKTESQSRLRFKRDGDNYSILIAIGMNDCKYDSITDEENERMSIDVFEKNIVELVSLAKDMNCKFGMVGLNPIDESRCQPFEETWFSNVRVKQFNDTIKKVCETGNVPFFDFFDTMLEEDYPALLSDGLHPNEKGYEWMYEHINKFLEENNLFP